MQLNVIWIIFKCPLCQASTPSSEKYSRDNNLKKLNSEIKDLEEKLEGLRAVRSVVQNPAHPIIKANMADDAMNL